MTHHHHTYIIIGLLVLCAVMLIWWYLNNKKSSAQIPEDEQTLKDQNEKFQAEEDSRSMKTMDELIEMSWEFLTRITEAVMTKFSEEVQQKILELGIKLVSIGMAYHHVVYTNERERSLKKEESKEIKL